MGLKRLTSSLGLTSLLALALLNINGPNASANPLTDKTTTASNPQAIWIPPLKTSWQWQLSSIPTAPYLDVDMYDIDGFDASAAKVADLHNSRPGRRVVCYISAGSWEPWRPDAQSFPTSLRGAALDPPWGDERWLDIRAPALKPLMAARIDMCKQKGFDAIEPDNIDAYSNRNGFGLTARNQLDYNRWLADTAHQRGLSIALKNDNAQIPTLLSSFDFAINEQCWEYSECTTAQNGGYGYDQFVRAGKAVFQVEYNLATTAFCPRSNSANFNSLKKREDLGAYRVACR